MITAEERKRLKGMGVLSCNDGENFAIRVITKNGVMTSEEMKAVSETADKFGCGKFCFTTRLTVEIMYVPYENIVPALAYLEAAGLKTGGTGAKVRPLVCCKGTYCVFGLCDTQRITDEMHKKFYEGYREVTLPHKFKIAVGGCPNNCVKPDLNDVGLVGARRPNFAAEACRGCKKCFIATVCPVDAITERDGKRVIDTAKCVHCGKCYQKCPFKAVPSGVDGFRIFLGGRWGKKSRKGTQLPGLFTEEEAVDTVEKAILLFKERAFAGERFGAMIDRIGEEEVIRLIAGRDLLERKEEILALAIGARA